MSSKLCHFGFWFCVVAVVVVALMVSHYTQITLGTDVETSQDPTPITLPEGQQLTAVPPPAHFLVPYEKNELFVGRSGLLSEIFNELNEAKERRYNHRLALYGMGGVGKTQTVLAYVYSMKTFYNSIFWINAADQATLLDGFQKIAIEIDERRLISESTPAETANPVLAWFARQIQWLLVIDNLEDSSVIEGFLPTTDSEGHTLITTRNPYTFGIPTEGLEVNVLNQDEAVELLLLLSETASPTTSATSKNAAREIVEELDYLPLTIEVAAGYIRESSRSIDSFLAIYQENVQDIHQWLPDGNRNYEHTLATVWEMPFNIIKKDTDCPEAFQLLQLFAFLNPDVILVDFLVAGSDPLNSELSNLLSNPVQLDRLTYHMQGRWDEAVKLYKTNYTGGR